MRIAAIRAISVPRCILVPGTIPGRKASLTIGSVWMYSAFVSLSTVLRRKSMTACTTYVDIMLTRNSFAPNFAFAIPISAPTSAPERNDATRTMTMRSAVGTFPPSARDIETADMHPA